MTELRIRRAARAIVLDPADRVLLVLFRLPHVDVWGTPGGGVDPGESHLEAVRRELHEEVGYTEVTIGPLIWTRTHMFSMSDDFDGQTDTFFLVRVDSPALPTPLLTEEELASELVVDCAWWTLDEIQASASEFAPRRLGMLLAELIMNGPPTEPVDVGV